ncbi:hypothetical protein BH23VER1_BH23VER1_11270 [soil metagenome]
MRIYQFALAAALVFGGGHLPADAQLDPTSTSVARDRTDLLGAETGIDTAERALMASTRGNSEIHAPPSPGDDDLGEQLLLVPRSIYEPWTLFGTAGVFFTDNAGLEEAMETDDTYFTGEAGLTYLPRLTGNLFAEVGARYKTYRYDERDDLDFDSLRTDLGLINVFRGFYDISLFGSYTYRRLTDGSHDEFYRNHSAVTGVYLPIRLGPKHSAFTSLLADFSLSGDPDLARRHEYSAQVGYRFRPLEELELSLSYRVSYLDFTEIGRGDFNQYIGAAATYKPTDWVELALTGGFSINDSDLEGADYEVGTLGGALSLIMRF